jgi:hypothetical protein
VEGRYTERIFTPEKVLEQKLVINISEHDSADCATLPPGNGKEALFQNKSAAIVEMSDIRNSH